MGFQNENQLKVGALVKATINNKVVEAKVINIGFNRVTLRSEKVNEVSCAFNSEKFLKWFNHTPLSEVAKNHAENDKKDILEGIKIVTSGLSVKERTTTPKQKEDKYKLAFDYAEWLQMLKNRNTDRCYYDTLNYMDRVGTTLFNVIREYALRLDKELEAELNDFSPSGFWAKYLPKNKNEALFVAQLLCDGGINKYGLSCAGLTAGLLADNLWSYGLRDEDYDDEGNVIAEREIVANKEGEIE